MKKVMFWLKVIGLILLWGVLLPRFVKAQTPATFDNSFSGDGKLSYSFTANGHSNANSIAVQPDGKIIVAGGTWIPTVAGTSQIALARYLPSGDPDNGFGNNGKMTIQVNGLDTYVSRVLVMPDGKILMAGSVSTATQRSFALFRYLTDGTPDASFDGDGILVLPASNLSQGISALALQPDGKILVGGYLQNPNTGYDNFAVLRFKANGQPDPSFDGDGLAVTVLGDAYASVYALLVQTDGKIVAAGYAMQNGYREFAAVRYQSNGTPDHTFSGDGLALVSMSDLDNSAYDAALQTDGKIVLAGSAHISGTGYSAVQNFAAIRLKTNGELDETFSGDGKVSISVSGHADGCRALVLQPDGKIVLGGYAHSNTDFGADAALVRLKTNGDPDPSFDGDGMATLPLQTDNSDEFHALALQADGKIVAAGYALLGNFQAFAAARILTGLTVDTTVPTVFSGKISLYPNPVRDQATLEYELTEPENITLNLYDVQGRFLQNLLPTAAKTAGHHQEALAFDQGLPAGTYLLRLESASGNIMIKVIL